MKTILFILPHENYSKSECQNLKNKSITHLSTCSKPHQYSYLLCFDTHHKFTGKNKLGATLSDDIKATIKQLKNLVILTNKLGKNTCVKGSITSFHVSNDEFLLQKLKIQAKQM